MNDFTASEDLKAKDFLRDLFNERMQNKYASKLRTASENDHPIKLEVFCVTEGYHKQHCTITPVFTGASINLFCKDPEVVANPSIFTASHLAKKTLIHSAMLWVNLVLRNQHNFNAALHDRLENFDCDDWRITVGVSSESSRVMYYLETNNIKYVDLVSPLANTVETLTGFKKNPVVHTALKAHGGRLIDVSINADDLTLRLDTVTTCREGNTNISYELRAAYPK